MADPVDPEFGVEPVLEVAPDPEVEPLFEAVLVWVVVVEVPVGALEPDAA